MTDIKSKKPAETNNSPVWRNIVIGVLTTVCVSATVYFLGFNNKSSGSSKLTRQKATYEAWDAYVAAENLAYRNGVSIMMDNAQFENFNEMLVEVKTESFKFQSALQQLIKKEDLDPDMVTLFKRRLETEKKAMPYADKLFADLDKILDSARVGDWEDDILGEKISKKLIEYGQQNQRMLQRSLTDIEELARTLSRRYEKPFDLNAFYVVQQKNNRDIYDILNDEQVDSTASQATKDYLTGTWKPKHRTTTLSLNGDGQYRWDVPSTPEEKISKGSWQVINKQLVLTDVSVRDSATNAYKKWYMEITNVSPKSFSVQFNIPPYYFLTMQRQ